MQKIKYVAFSAATLVGGLLMSGCSWGSWYTQNGWPRAIALWLNEEFFS
jgi:hypothetical protein